MNHPSCHHATCRRSAMQVAEAVCASRGERLTDHRRRVLDIVWQGHKAWSAAEIMAEMDTPHPPITYRALEFLKSVGLVHHITSLNAYIGCGHAGQGHVAQLLVCVACRTVDELTLAAPVAQIEQAAEARGFQPQSIHMEVLGLCAACKHSA